MALLAQLVRRRGLIEGERGVDVEPDPAVADSRAELGEASFVGCDIGVRDANVAGCCGCPMIGRFAEEGDDGPSWAKGGQQAVEVLSATGVEYHVDACGRLLEVGGPVVDHLSGAEAEQEVDVVWRRPWLSPRRRRTAPVRPRRARHRRRLRESTRAAQPGGLRGRTATPKR